MVNLQAGQQINQALLQKAQTGDNEALNLLFETYRPQLLRFLKQKVRDKDLAEELTQETFLKAFTALSKISEDSNFSAWIYTIARRVCIDHWRYLGRRPTTISYDAEKLAPAQSHWFCSDVLATQHAQVIVKEVLGSLSKRQRLAIVLRDIEGYSYQECAETMGLSEAAYTSLLYRARVNFVQQAVPILHPKAKQIGFGYRECLSLLQTFSLSEWPENPASDFALRARHYFDGVATNFDLARVEDYPEKLDEFLLSQSQVEGAKELVGADFGAGAGHYATQLAGKFGVVHALDIAPKMIERAKKRIEEERIQNIILTVGDVNCLPYTTGSFDVGYSAVVLHHVFDPGASIKEMVRTLKPGGRLIVADLAKHQNVILHQEKNDLWSGFDEKQISSWFKEAQLEDIWVKKHSDFNFTFKLETGEKIKVPVIAAGGRKPIVN